MFPVNLQPMPPGEISLQKEDCTKEVEIVADWIIASLAFFNEFSVFYYPNTFFSDQIWLDLKTDRKGKLKMNVAFFFKRSDILKTKVTG